MGKLTLVAVFVLSGCTHTFAQEAVAPNPLVVADPTARTSERITIVRGDVDLVVPMTATGERQAADAQQSPMDPQAMAHKTMTSLGEYYRWPLENSASWTMVSRDDLRFHVQIDHKWLDYVDLAGWTAVLEDDQGHVYAPASVEHRRARLLYPLHGGDDDPGALAIYRGVGDIVFRDRDLLTVNRRWLRLTIHHGVDRFEYTWKFQPDVAAR